MVLPYPGTVHFSLILCAAQLADATSVEAMTVTLTGRPSENARGGCKAAGSAQPSCHARLLKTARPEFQGWPCMVGASAPKILSAHTPFHTQEMVVASTREPNKVSKSSERATEYIWACVDEIIRPKMGIDPR